LSAGRQILDTNSESSIKDALGWDIVEGLIQSVFDARSSNGELLAAGVPLQTYGNWSCRHIPQLLVPELADDSVSQGDLSDALNNPFKELNELGNDKMVEAMIELLEGGVEVGGVRLSDKLEDLKDPSLVLPWIQMEMASNLVDYGWLNIDKIQPGELHTKLVEEAERPFIWRECNIMMRRYTSEAIKGSPDVLEVMLPDNNAQLAVTLKLAEIKLSANPNLRIVFIPKKDNAVINDASVADVERLLAKHHHFYRRLIQYRRGDNPRFQVVAGPPAYGMPLDLISEEVGQALRDADIVYSTGQANLWELRPLHKESIYHATRLKDLFTNEYIVGANPDVASMRGYPPIFVGVNGTEGPYYSNVHAAEGPDERMTLREHLKLPSSEIDRLMDAALETTGCTLLLAREAKNAEWFRSELENNGVYNPVEYLRKVTDENGHLLPERRQEAEELFNNVVLTYPHQSRNDVRLYSFLDRHAGQCEHFARTALPLIIDEKLGSGEKRLRLKMIGSSTGEEAATLYYYIKQAFEDEENQKRWGSIDEWDIKIEGIDISTFAIGEARRVLLESPKDLHPAENEGSTKQKFVDVIEAIPASRRADMFKFTHGNAAYARDREEFLEDADAIFANESIGYITADRRRELIDDLRDRPVWVYTNNWHVYERCASKRNMAEIRNKPHFKDYISSLAYVIAPPAARLAQPRLDPLSAQQILTGVGLIDGLGNLLPASLGGIKFSLPAKTYHREKRVLAIEEALQEGEMSLPPSRIQSLNYMLRDETVQQELRAYANRILAAHASTLEGARMQHDAMLLDRVTLEEIRAQCTLEGNKGLGCMVYEHDQVLSPRLRSTQRYIEFIERNAHLFKGKKVIDLGTGSGALAIALARAGAEVVAVDITDIALQVAKLNIEREPKEVQDRITLGKSNLYRNLSSVTDIQRFDYVVCSNPVTEKEPDPNDPASYKDAAGQKYRIVGEAIRELPKVLKEETGEAFFYSVVSEDITKLTQTNLRRFLPSNRWDMVRAEPVKGKLAIERIYQFGRDRESKAQFERMHQRITRINKVQLDLKRDPVLVTEGKEIIVPESLILEGKGYDYLSQLKEDVRQGRIEGDYVEGKYIKIGDVIIATDEEAKKMATDKSEENYKNRTILLTPDMEKEIEHDCTARRLVLRNYDFLYLESGIALARAINSEKPGYGYIRRLWYLITGEEAKMDAIIQAISEGRLEIPLLPIGRVSQEDYRSLTEEAFKFLKSA